MPLLLWFLEAANSHSWGLTYLEALGSLAIPTSSGEAGRRDFQDVCGHCYYQQCSPADHYLVQKADLMSKASQNLDWVMDLNRAKPDMGYGRLGPDMSTRLLFLAEEQGHGVSPAACGPPRCPLPSPAPSTYHLLRRPQRPLTGLPATQAATGHRAGGCEVPRASPSAEHGLDRGRGNRDQQVLTT